MSFSLVEERSGEKPAEEFQIHRRKKQKRSKQPIIVGQSALRCWMEEKSSNAWIKWGHETVWTLDKNGHWTLICGIAGRRWPGRQQSLFSKEKMTHLFWILIKLVIVILVYFCQVLLLFFGGFWGTGVGMGCEYGGWLLFWRTSWRIFWNKKIKHTCKLT